MKETMKVIEAISQLKIQEDRISRAIEDLTPVAANRSSAKKVDGLTPNEFADRAKSAFDSASKLIDRYIAMKEAVNEFNAGTKVTVNGVEMTVASAIYLKSYGIEQKKHFLAYLTNCLKSAEVKINIENGPKLDEAAERNAKQNFEGDQKSDKAAYLAFLEEYREKNQYVLVDPLNLRDKIEKLSDEIAKFEAGVDTAIQIANATHDITIEY